MSKKNPPKKTRQKAHSFLLHRCHHNWPGWQMRQPISPQFRKVQLGEAGVLPQLPVCVVAHPGIITGLSVDAERKKEKKSKFNLPSLRSRWIQIYIELAWKTLVGVPGFSLPAPSASPSAALLFSVSAPLQPPGLPPPAVCQQHKVEFRVISK